MNLDETVRSVPLPEALSFIDDETLLADFEITEATGYVAYLMMTARAPGREGWIYYHPIVFAPGNMSERSETSIRKKVLNAIAVFQAAIKGGTARMAKPGDALEWRTR